MIAQFMQIILCTMSPTHYTPVEMYFSSTCPIWAASQAVVYWVSVSPELVNPCTILTGKHIILFWYSVYRHSVSFANYYKQEVSNKELTLPQISSELSTNNATGEPQFAVRVTCQYRRKV